MTCLRFPDEQTAQLALKQYTTGGIQCEIRVDENGEEYSTYFDAGPIEWRTSSHHHALDIIGTIYKPTGVMLQGEDGEYPEMAPIPGWHCNLIGELPAEAEQYVVIPNNPVRVFL